MGENLLIIRQQYAEKYAKAKNERDKANFLIHIKKLTNRIGDDFHFPDSAEMPAIEKNDRNASKIACADLCDEIVEEGASLNAEAKTAKDLGHFGKMSKTDLLRQRKLFLEIQKSDDSDDVRDTLELIEEALGNLERSETKALSFTAEIARGKHQVIVDANYKWEWPWEIGCAKYRDKHEPIVKEIESEKLGYWGGLMRNGKVSEAELISVLAKLKGLSRSAINDTRCLNEIFKAEYSGYIKQEPQNSHFWVINAN